MNPCDEIRALLPLFVGGDLEAPLTAGVLAHVGLGEGERRLGEGEPASGGLDDGEPRSESGEAGCAACRRALEELREVRAVLLALPERSPAPAIDVWPTVRRSLVGEGLLNPGTAVGVPEAALRRPAGRLLVLRRVAAAAAAVAALALGVHLVRPGGPAQTGAGSESGPGVEQGVAAEGGSSVDDRLLSDPSLSDPSLSDPSLSDPLLPGVAPGGLRRLGATEKRLSVEALPFVEGMPGWPQLRSWPGRPVSPVDPSRPTFASDRSLR